MNILITGANRGIGLGFVRHYLGQGARVWACYRSDPGGLRSIASDTLHLLQWDVTVDQPRDFADQAGIPDALHLLINNAGIYGPKKAEGQGLETVTAETMHRVFDVDCVGPLRVVQQLLGRLVAGRGVIANVSSKMGSVADNSSGGCYAYRAAKAALVMVSRSMAMDLGPRGVRVITLHPGWVRTDMTDGTGLIDVEESVAGMTRVIEHAAAYEPGAFVAFDGQLVPY